MQVDRCSACGVCDGAEIRPRLHEGVEGALYPRKVPVPESCTEGFQYWMQYTRLGKVRFFGQLEIAQCFARAVRRSGLRAAYTKGFHPHLKLSFNDALPVGLESRVAEACLTLTEPADPEKIRDALNQHLPEGMRVGSVARLGRRRVEPQNRRATYLVAGLDPLAVHDVVRNWRRDLTEILVKKTKRGR